MKTQMSMKYTLIKYLTIFVVAAIVGAHNHHKKTEKQSQNNKINRNLQEGNGQKSEKCSHSTLDTEYFENYKKVYSKLLEERSEQDEQIRKLQSQTIAPIRVTTNTTSILNSSFTQEEKDYLMKLVNASIDFISKLLKVQPVANNNMPNVYNNKCFDVYLSDEEVQNGYPNSDLHLIFLTENDQNFPFSATASWCSFDRVFLRPNVGRISVNLHWQEGKNGGEVEFFEDLQTFIHEIIHILGFSDDLYQYWINPKTGKFYNNDVNDIITKENIRDLDTMILKSQNVVEVSRKYFGCDSMNGMQLENQGTGSSYGCHWEKTLLYSDTMTPAMMNVGRRISVFTIALLRDTGFWAEVNENMSENHTWGKNKGCDFVYKACKSENKYREFTESSNISCSYSYDGPGFMTEDKFGDSCNYVAPNLGRICDNGTRPENGIWHFDHMNDFYESYQYDSKCFQSNLQSPDSTLGESNDQRCHKSACSEDNNTIFIYLPQIKDFKIECPISESGKNKEVFNNGKLLGTIQCPVDFEAFCGNKNCINNCSKQGYCIHGKCVCINGYTGQDCSQKCPLNQINFNSQCVNSCPSGYYKNPDNTCKATCPDNYYPNKNECSFCDISCSKCNGPKSNNCTACQFMTYLEGNVCVKTCSQGYKLNEQKKICQSIIQIQCPQGCKECESTQKCTTCESGFVMNGSKCEKVIVCPDSKCQTCDQRNTQECSQCYSGFYLNKLSKKCVQKDDCPSKTFANTKINECTNCANGCEQCISDTQCQKCDEKNNYRLDKYTCILCNKNCKSCQATNQDACTSCENNMYLFESECVSDCPQKMFKGNNNACQNCSKGCLSCSNEQQCQSCDIQAGYKSFENICISAVDCISPCKTCGSYEPKTCTSCTENYYLQGINCVVKCNSGFYADSKSKTCIQCDKNCAECESEANVCTKCSDKQILHEKQCVDSCPQTYQNIQGKCIKLQDEAAKENKEKTTTFSNLLNYQIIQLLLIAVILI